MSELCVAWYLCDKVKGTASQSLYVIGRIFLWEYKKNNFESVKDKETFTENDIIPVFNMMKALGVVSDEEAVMRLLNLLPGTLFWSEWRYGWGNEANQEDLIVDSQLKTMSLEQVVAVGRVDDIKNKKKVKE